MPTRKPARRAASSIAMAFLREADGSMSFAPDRIEVRRGEQIKFALKNAGMQDHEFILAMKGENVTHGKLMERFPEMEHDDPNGKPEAYVKSQAHEGWRLVPGRYDDGGLSGASLDRAALQKLLADVRAGKITIVVVYKVDRLTRSLADFAKIVDVLDAYNASFVSVTQQFNTTTSMGRLTLSNLWGLP
jgi:Resolvase, N terminal domain